METLRTTTRLVHAAAIAGACAAALPAAGQAQPLAVTNPAPVKGVDVDPYGSQQVDLEVGNLALAALNADAGRFTLGFDSDAYTTFASLDRVTFDADGEIGRALTVDFTATNANWLQVIDNATRATSGGKALSLRQLEMPGPGGGRYVYFTFSEPMRRVGLVLGNVHADDRFEVAFYGDAAGDDYAGRAWLDAFEVKGQSRGADGAEVFVGYEHAGGVERVQVVFSEVGEPSQPRDFRALDDVSFVPLDP